MNVSTGGMFIRAADPPPVGTRLRVEVEWASSVIPLAEGEVVWSRPTAGEYAAGFGVKFTFVDPQTRNMLEALVESGGQVSTLRTARMAVAVG